MGIALTLPAGGGPIGPGTAFTINNDAGSFAPLAGDWARVTLSDPGGSHFVEAQGSAYCVTPPNVQGWVSVSFEPVHPAAGNHAQLVAGAAVAVTIEWWRADLSLHHFDTVAGAWTYDPVGGLGELLSVQFRTASSGGGGATLDDILAAVRKTFP